MCSSTTVELIRSAPPLVNTSRARPISLSTEAYSIGCNHHIVLCFSGPLSVSEGCHRSRTKRNLLRGVTDKRTQEANKIHKQALHTFFIRLFIALLCFVHGGFILVGRTFVTQNFRAVHFGLFFSYVFGDNLQLLFNLHVFSSLKSAIAMSLACRRRVYVWWLCFSRLLVVPSFQKLV